MNRDLRLQLLQLLMVSVARKMLNKIIS